MERIPVPPATDTELTNVLTSIMDNVASNPIVLDSAPTTANQLLKEGQRGVYGGFLYETVNGTTYQYGTAV